MIELSTDQTKAKDGIISWFKEKKGGYISLGGYAGTGKTTLTADLRKDLAKQDKKLSVAFCSYTGKASLILKKSLQEMKSIYPQDSVSTIHSLIYSPIVNTDEEIVGWERKEEMECDLIIVDEASMVDQEIWKDLMSYQIPIIAVGDHGQLPPIRGKFNLMDNPHLKLEEIHRQAKGNPIIELSIHARKNGEIPVGRFSDTVMKLDKHLPETGELVEDILMGYDENLLVLCGYNHTRVKLNQHIRSTLGLDTPTPEPGDRVICLRNNHTEEIYNGMLGVIEKIKIHDEEWYDGKISFDGKNELYHGLMYSLQFNALSGQNFGSDRKNTIQGDLFDFGYAITVHKAQGSQASKVLLFEERFSKMDDDQWRRWLYTAVTRAQHELYIVGTR